jgi:hypothetical protein
VLVVGDGPLDVLRAAVDGVGLRGERHEPAEVCLPQPRAVVGGELERFRARRVEHVPRPVDLPADQRLGPAPDGGDDPAVAPPRHGIAAEHDAAEHRLDQRLDQDGDRVVCRVGPLPRVQDSRHGVDERVPAADPDHRCELAGHRRCRGVLHDRGAAGHQCPVVAARPLEGFPHGRVLLHLGTAVDGIAEPRREDETWERGEAGPGPPRQGGRLAAHQRRLDRGVVAQVDQEPPF